jgi:NAD(P)-dependent dehydrogenase (short-subunit alcohol dehydrogenase family)
VKQAHDSAGRYVHRMDLGLAGKTVFISGSTAGIGYATARQFAREGAAVILNGRVEDRVTKAVAVIKAEIPNASVRGIAADISTVEGIQKIAAAAPSVDVLINNAGIFEPKSFDQITDPEWLRFFETNVMSGVRLSRQYLPGMLQRNWGRIVFISSESAIQIPVEMIHYGVTKTAQLALARGLAEGTRGTGVTVNSVLPGPTGSEGVADFVASLAKQRGITLGQMEKEFFATARPSSLLGRFATPQEVANLIVYTASVAASATNGSSLRVDGGVVRSIT